MITRAMEHRGKLLLKETRFHLQSENREAENKIMAIVLKVNFFTPMSNGKEQLGACKYRVDIIKGTSAL